MLALAAITFASIMTAAPVDAQTVEPTPTSLDGCTRGEFLSFYDQESPGAPPFSGDPADDYFHLSQSYPDHYPTSDYPWLDQAIGDLTTDEDAAAYMDRVKRYALEGNTDPAVDWAVQDNPIRTWYHVPWLDASLAGREYQHGLTSELSSLPGVLAPTQLAPVQTWAVGAYNDRGGWSVGQMWCDPDDPRPAALNPNGDEPNSFPNGTAVFKLLFTSADTLQVPYLQGTKEWTANIFETTPPRAELNPNSANPTPVPGEPVPKRVDRTVRLIQLDLAVRDDRLPLGWAFMTYIYFAGADVGEGIDPVVWHDRLVPVGLQWGNDPGVTKAMIDSGAELTGTWVSPTVRRWRSEIAEWERGGGELANYPVQNGFRIPDLKLGWGGRLAGPLDNPNSSCMSCHGAAGSPIVPESAPWLSSRISSSDNLVSPERLRLPWFANTPAGVPFSPDQINSFDYSLQSAMAYTRWKDDRCSVSSLFFSRGVPPTPVPGSDDARADPGCSTDIVASSGIAGNSVWWLIPGVAVLGLGVAQTNRRARRRGAENATDAHANEGETS